MIHVERLTKAASFVAIAVWLRSSLTEVAIQFDERNGQRDWIEDCCSHRCFVLPQLARKGVVKQINVLIEEECGRQR